MYRFMLPRQMPLVAALLILTAYFLQKKKYLLLALTTSASVLLHSSFVFQILLISLYLILEKIFIKKIDYKLILYPFIGLVIALLFNPYFPNNISFLYTQIFKVNLIANLFNAEWKPWPLIEFIKNNALILFYIAFSLILLIKNKKITKTQTLFF